MQPNRFIEQLKNRKLNEISELMSKGYVKDFEELIEKINNQLEYEGLPEGLQAKYDSIKDNPVDEPILYELALAVENKTKSIIDLVLHVMSESEMDEFSANDIAFFAGKVMKKISSLKDENGIYKKTTKLLNWQPPKPSKIKQYETIISRLGDVGKELLSIKEGDMTVDTSAINKKFNDLSDEFDKFLLHSCNLDDADKLTEWEKALVVEMTKDAFQGYMNSFLGKR